MIQTPHLTWTRQSRSGLHDPAVTVLRHAEAPVIGVAGAGRELVARVLTQMLNESGVNTVCGWSSAADRLAALTSETRIVVEVGPHAEWADEGALSALAVVGLAPDELGEGEDADAYQTGLFQVASRLEGWMVVGSGCSRSARVAQQARVKVRMVSATAGAQAPAAAWLRGGEIIARDPLLGIERRVCRIEDGGFNGPYLTNVLLVAVAANLGAGGTVEGARAVALGQTLDDHAETVALRRRVRWVSDTAATTPGQALGSLSAAADAGSSVYLIAGGRYGGQPLSRWASAVRASAEAVLLVDSAAEVLAAALLEADGGAHIIRCADLDDALGVADRLSVPGDTVLLSPACEPDRLDGPTPGERLRGYVDAGRRSRRAA